MLKNLKKHATNMLTSLEILKYRKKVSKKDLDTTERDLAVKVRGSLLQRRGGSTPEMVMTA